MRKQLLAGLAAFLLPVSPTLAWSGLIGVSEVVAQATNPDQLFQQGVQQYQQSQYSAALATFNQLLPRLQAAAEQPRKLEVLNYLGLIYEAQGQFSQALETNQQALALARKLGDRQAEGVSLSNLGSAYSRLGNYANALELYQQGLDLLRGAGDREGEASTLSAMGRIYRNQGQYAPALKLYQQALEIQRQIQDRQGEGTTLNNIGVVYTAQSDYARAIDIYQQALVLRRETRDRRGEGLTLNNLAGAYRSAGQYAKALELFQQALAAWRSVGDRAGQGTALNSIGFLYTVLGQSDKALQFYEQALAIRREVGDRKGEAVTLNNLGQLAASQNQFSKGRSYYEQALPIYRQLEDRAGEGVTLNNLGEVLRRQGQYGQALEFYQQSLALRRQVGNRSGEGITLNNLGATYQGLGNSAQALDAYQQALAIFQEIGDRPNSATTLGNIGVTYLELKDPPAATKSLRQSIELLESLRPGLSDANKVSIFETQQKNYKLLEQTLIAQGLTSEALEISERGRARAFVELLASRLAARGQQAELPVVSPPTIQDIQQIAREQQATLVEYSLLNRPGTSQQDLAIWVVQPTGEIAFRRQPLETLNPNLVIPNLVESARYAIGVRGLMFQEQTGLVEQVQADLNQRRVNEAKLQQLHQLLIQPIADLLPRDPRQRVIFIPQDTLFMVPFAALQDAAGTYLIETHTILTVPSIQILALTRQQRQKWANQPSPPDQVLVVGNPTMPKLSPRAGAPAQQLTSLPGSEREATAIAALFNTEALIGNQATKAELMKRIPRAKIIHLATHGLLDNLVPSEVPGAIALAPQGRDSGFLTADDILDLELKADLVVLSACDTGRGKITGDGVVGLSRSLILAGAPSVIVSLWQVPDAPTATLMTAFYQNRLTQQDKAQALRQAMLATLKQYPSPQNWAAFTLIGEAE